MLFIIILYKRNNKRNDLKNRKMFHVKQSLIYGAQR